LGESQALGARRLGYRVLSRGFGYNSPASAGLFLSRVEVRRAKFDAVALGELIASRNARTMQ
jgi:hypothetical protein